MTDAHICNQTTQDNKNTTTDRSDDCAINDPTNDFLEQEDCRNDHLVIIANNNDKDKPNKTQTNNTDNKSSMITNLEENCENVFQNSDNKLNDQVKNSDTVLKYVYKKTDINASNKTKGHVKNSLKRKKRSLLSDSEIQAHRQPRKFQINDHQTDREEIAIPQTKPQGIINRDDLADFNIETLHENIKPSINILMKDSKGFVGNQRQNHNTKKYGNDEIDVNDHRDKSNNNIKSTASDTDDIPTKYVRKSKNVENDEHDKNEKKNYNSTVYDSDGINNDYIDEYISVENNSNEFVENGKEKLPQEFEDGSRDYNQKGSRNIKSDSFNKDGTRNDYTKESKNDNNNSKEYDVKDTRNIKSDSFHKDDRRNDYTQESKNDNKDSNEYDVKDAINIKGDSFNKDDRRNDYSKESKNDDDNSNEYDVKDARNIKSDSFNKDGRRNDYTKESKNDNDEINEYDVKNTRNIKSNFFNKDDTRSDYTKESKNDNDESNEYDVKDTRNIKSDSFNKDGRRNDYTKESKNDNGEINEYDVKDTRNIKSNFFNKDDTRSDYTKESKNDNDERNEFEGKDRENFKSLNYGNRKENKQYSNIDKNSKARNEDYLTDYKDTLKSDEILGADFLEESAPTPRNNLSEKNLDIFKKYHTNNDSEIVNHKDLKETSYESNEKVNDVEETKLLNKDNEEGFTADKKRNNSIKLQEVDLDDFSFESIEDDKDQSNAHIIHFNKNNNGSTQSENVALIPNTLEKPFTGRNSKKPPLIKNGNKNEKQIKINDDEIKPVKELNYSESQSEEESKEYKESEKSKDKELSINDRLKSVIEKSHKLHPNSKTENENTDLKAQFERIPENYIHTDVKSNSTEKKTLVENSGEEGTLDSFTPNNYEYDKDLNIKFSDLTIKLPEIKLPKDILAYAREETKNHKEDYDNSEDKEKDNSEDKEKDNSEDKEKDNSRNKENEEEQEEDDELEDYVNKPKIYRNNKQNGEDFYQSYFNPSVDLSNDHPQKKQKYSNFHNEDSGEDLYEKFVRERFGKRNYLKKRSEKLIDYNPVSKNYNLYKNVRKALKRANKIEKEAEKSKDPNYMWTLEYGGKL